MNTGFGIPPSEWVWLGGFRARSTQSSTERGELLVISWYFSRGGDGGSLLGNGGGLHVGGQAVDVLVGLLGGWWRVAHCLLHGGVHVLAGVVTVS